MYNVSRVISIKLSSMHRIAVMVRPRLWVCITQPFSVQGLDGRFDIAFIRPCVGRGVYNLAHLGSFMA